MKTYHDRCEVVTWDGGDWEQKYHHTHHSQSKETVHKHYEHPRVVNYQKIKLWKTLFKIHFTWGEPMARIWPCAFVIICGMLTGDTTELAGDPDSCCFCCCCCWTSCRRAKFWIFCVTFAIHKAENNNTWKWIWLESITYLNIFYAFNTSHSSNIYNNKNGWQKESRARQFIKKCFDSKCKL